MESKRSHRKHKKRDGEKKHKKDKDKKHKKDKEHRHKHRRHKHRDHSDKKVVESHAATSPSGYPDDTVAIPVRIVPS